MTVRRKLLGVAACVAAILTLVSVVDAKGFRRYLRLRHDVEVIQERNRVLSEQNDALLREINALRNDPVALERAAREELGYIKPGELVFHLE
ncbi:MAG TPA: septum formation initiator family protein [Archangium sp.]|jgi:cell division protein FtsB|uniref:FtsB family cell division protein n=1 Tax=Archangium sp. TaxID=1872627 RepID=UPI002EDAE6EC